MNEYLPFLTYTVECMCLTFDLVHECITKHCQDLSLLLFLYESV